MKRRCLLVLVLAIFTVGVVFAQDNYESMPKNTVTIDFGPTIVGSGFDIIGDSGDHSSGLGIGVQYERQIQEKLTVQGRFAYLRHSYEYITAESESSFSLEVHTRFYPAGKTFFLDGMFGYAGLSVSFSDESDSISAYRNYIKYGAKIGWRIDFGNQGGFVFEPSLGYYGGLGLGDTFIKKMENYFGRDLTKEYFDKLENFIFIGGPRISLSCGWRF
jgi:hypothetical protein